MASFTIKHTSLCSSIIQSGGSGALRRAKIKKKKKSDIYAFGSAPLTDCGRSMRKSAPPIYTMRKVRPHSSDNAEEA